MLGFTALVVFAGTYLVAGFDALGLGAVALGFDALWLGAFVLGFTTVVVFVVPAFVVLTLVLLGAELRADVLDVLLVDAVLDDDDVLGIFFFSFLFYILRYANNLFH